MLHKINFRVIITLVCDFYHMPSSAAAFRPLGASSVPDSMIVLQADIRSVPETPCCRNQAAESTESLAGRVQLRRQNLPAFGARELCFKKLLYQGVKAVHFHSLLNKYHLA